MKLRTLIFRLQELDPDMDVVIQCENNPDNTHPLSRDIYTTIGMGIGGNEVILMPEYDTDLWTFDPAMAWIEAGLPSPRSE